MVIVTNIQGTFSMCQAPFEALFMDYITEYSRQPYADAKVATLTLF